jgi:hypothetical protein
MALLAGQRVTTAGNRTGVVALDLSTSVQSGHPGVIVLYADNTYTEEVGSTLVNVTGGWISGTGPGA